MRLMSGGLEVKMTCSRILQPSSCLKMWYQWSPCPTQSPDTQMGDSHPKRKWVDPPTSVVPDPRWPPGLDVTSKNQVATRRLGPGCGCGLGWAGCTSSFKGLLRYLSRTQRIRKFRKTRECRIPCGNYLNTPCTNWSRYWWHEFFKHPRHTVVDCTSDDQRVAWMHAIWAKEECLIKPDNFTNYKKNHSCHHLVFHATKLY